MQRINVSTVEKFRRMINRVSSWDNEKSLLESLKGEFEGNDKTNIGNAYHKIIEGKYDDVNKGGRDWFMSDGIYFTGKQAEPAMEYRAKYLEVLREVNKQAVYETDFGPIQITLRIDALLAAEMHDAKTKFSAPSFYEYRDSCQWKFYMDVMNYDLFKYFLFEFNGFKQFQYTGDIKTIGINTTVEAHPAYEVHRYINLKADLTALLNRFLKYLTDKNYLSLLKPALENENSFF